MGHADFKRLAPGHHMIFSVTSVLCFVAPHIYPCYHQTVRKVNIITNIVDVPHVSKIQLSRVYNSYDYFTEKIKAISLHRQQC